MSGNGSETDATDAQPSERRDEAERGESADSGGQVEHEGPADGGDQADGEGRADDGVRADRGQPDAAEPHDSLLAALHVTRHLRVGLAVGIGLAAFLYLPRLPAFDRSIQGAEGFYLGLAFVLAATTAGLVTAALSIKTFLEPVLDRPAWLRRGGMAAMLGGLGWASTPLLAAGADAGSIDATLWRNVTSLAALALLVGTIGLHSAVKQAVATVSERIRRIERAAYWIALIGLLIAAANATGDAAPVRVAGSEDVATPFLIGALLAAVAVIPFAATAELSGRLPRWRIRSLQVGGLIGAVGTAWLVSLGGWDWLAQFDAPAALGLAVTVVPVGLGWAIAGLGLWTSARQREAAASPGEPGDGLADE
ncbi:hypothetical protein L593_08865 [Salinarchaeum sp. Harcht-Bsk1]|uniref:DUF7536 family protein n=1 Tax=Salinarchaeum sp. Harcht-Bsk1 TaxID=1333523 RepID=UPI0003422A6D|nr:hypothetical protein [Salinarchaeum sp. Harcht-Bsk1]AGN01718.1 hypothetical protein L593_08865 [Salinarchaeum sp. Harcht-Bsk1]